MSAVTHFAKDGDEIKPWPGASFKVLETPCHTAGHLVFIFRVDPVPGIQHESEDNPPSCLFSGDTIFIGGTGAFFEGNDQDMLQNFAKIGRECDKDTLIFPGHEYTMMTLEQVVRSGPNECPAALFTAAQMWWRARHRRIWHPALPTVPCRFDDGEIIHSRFRELRRLARHVQAAVRQSSEPGSDDELDDLSEGEQKEEVVQRPTVPLEGCYEPTDFDLIPDHIRNPFITLWRSDYETVCDLLDKGRATEAHKVAQEAETLFRDYEEHWSACGEGTDYEVPEPQDLARALCVLGCENRSGSFDSELLQRSIERFGGNRLTKKELQMLDAKCNGCCSDFQRVAKEVLLNSLRPNVGFVVPCRCYVCTLRKDHAPPTPLSCEADVEDTQDPIRARLLAKKPKTQQQTGSSNVSGGTRNRTPAALCFERSDSVGRKNSGRNSSPPYTTEIV